MIIPSIDLQAGQTVQLVQGARKALDAGDPRPLAERFGVVGEIAVIDLDAAMGRGTNAELLQSVLPMARCRVGGGIRDLATARGWLDAGAHRIIVGTAATPELLRQLPRERVIAALDARDGQIVVNGWQTATGQDVPRRMLELRDLVSGFLVTFVEVEGTMTGLPIERAAALREFAGDARLTVAGGVRSESEIGELDRLGIDCQVGMALYTGRVSLAGGLAAMLTSDRPDGLWPTVVCDESGAALGLAYSSPESLRVALDERRGVYWSRTRGLWRKGETSGHAQQLLRVDLDCDRDTLRFTVRDSLAPFCHTGARSCWDAPAHALPKPGLHALSRRLGAMPPTASASGASYTRRLLDDPALLASKVREEAAELCAAATPSEVRHEAADVLYFTLVRLAAAGVSLAEVERELGARALRVSRRPGDAKPSPLPAPTDVPPCAERPATPMPHGAAQRPANARDSSTPLAAGTQVLRRVSSEDAHAARPDPVDPATLAAASGIVHSVRSGGRAALRAHAERLGDLRPGDPLIIEPPAMRAALDALDTSARRVLEAAAERIHEFARAQRACITDLSLPVAGGHVGHRVLPVERAGCYAPGGRFPLPSSVLMTALAARAAGVREVVVASPRPAQITLAAAALAHADALLVVGGAHAVAALAFGCEGLGACDVVVGPGNRWVTAAKKLVAGHVGIDMLAGPSEVLILADDTSDARLIAADLLAQAEHDDDAVPMLATTSEGLIARVERELARQLESLPASATARRALANGFVVLAPSLDELARISDRIAPEHLEIMTQDAAGLARHVTRFGGLFIGANAAEVLGDYGVGPNHVLPTGGAARFTGGLSVLSFLATRTFVEGSSVGFSRALYTQTAALARLEGLEAHARAAEARLVP